MNEEDYAIDENGNSVNFRRRIYQVEEAGFIYIKHSFSFLWSFFYLSVSMPLFYRRNRSFGRSGGAPHLHPPQSLGKREERKGRVTSLPLTYAVTCTEFIFLKG